MKHNLKRISLMVREDQYDYFTKKGINLSGLIRDLVDDHLSENKIILSVSKETKELYDMVISNTGATDVELEQPFTESLKKLLKNRIKEMQKLEKKLEAIS